MKRTSEPSGGAQLPLVADVSRVVWEVLLENSPSKTVKKQKKDLTVDEDALRRNRTNPRELANEIFRITQHAYDGICFKKLEECERELCTAVSAILDTDPTVVAEQAQAQAQPVAAAPAAAAIPPPPAVAAVGGEDDPMDGLSVGLSAAAVGGDGGDQATGGGDAEMLDAEESAREAVKPDTNTETLSQKASQAVWGVIKGLFPAGATCVELNFNEETLGGLENKVTELGDLLNAKIGGAYRSVDILATFDALIKLPSIRSAVMEVIQKHNVKDQKSTEGLVNAFSADYRGIADEKFEQHLTRCRELYSSNSTNYTAPYVTITQSSGFGKSRVVYQLAQKLETQPTSNMRLLYMCARDIRGSTGFPVATPELFSFFFPSASEISIAKRLQCALDYAIAHWWSVQREWNGVFSAKDQGVSQQLAAKLAASSAQQTAALSTENTENTNPPPPDDAVLVVVIDEARSLLNKVDERSVTYFSLLRRALTRANGALWEDKEEGKPKPSIFAVLVDTNPQIDDFTTPPSKDPSSRSGKPDSTRLFPPFVLTQTMDVFLKCSKPIAIEQKPVPIDYKRCVLETNAGKIVETLLAMGRPLWYTHYTKVAKTDRLQEVLILGGRKLLCGLDPTKEESYKDDTMHGVAALLCRLGLRPQSSSAFASQVVANFMAVLHAVNYTHDAHISGYISEPFLTFAATRMWYARHPSSLTEHMLPQFGELLMQGVLDVGGIGEVVARIFLLLAMDAAIMRNTKVDAVAGAGSGLDSDKHRFRGQFCTVSQLLAELDGTADGENSPDFLRVTIEVKQVATTGMSSGSTSGATSDALSDAASDAMSDAASGSTESNPRQPKKRKSADEDSTSGGSSSHQASESKKTKKFIKYEEPTELQKAHWMTWMESWKQWHVGFSHFVELTQVPTKKTLWCMLGRRAAGVLPRGQKGADLIVPIFRRDPDEVSYMLVQVKNVDGQDDNFPRSALSLMTPSNVFKKKGTHRIKHELSEFSSKDIIRVFMGLRQSNKNGGARSYFMDGTGEDDIGAYTLCLRGMCKNPEFGSRIQSEPYKHWPFLGNGIWERLKELAESAWGSSMEAIRADLKHRKKYGGDVYKELPDDEVLEAARHTLEVVEYGWMPDEKEMKFGGGASGSAAGGV